MQLTTNQKRKFINLIAKGKVKAKDFKAIPERHFTRVSAMPIQDEIILTGAGDHEVNILPGTLFKCKEDGNEYLYSQIKEMESNVPFGCWYGIADNPPTEPAAIDEIEIMQVSAETQIKHFLDTNY